MVDKNIMRDIEKILVLAQKAHDHLQKNNIPKAKRKLKRIIKFDLDELSRLQKEKGNKKLLGDCAVVFKDAKEALRGLNSVQLFDEAKRLIDEIVKLEGHEYELQRSWEHRRKKQLEEEQKENELYEFWHKQIYALKLSHYTSQINARRLLKNGYNPGDKPVGWDLVMEAWDLVDSIDWIPEGSQFVSWGVSSKEAYQNRKKGLYVCAFEVYNNHMKTSETINYFTKSLRKKVEQMEQVLTSSDFEAYLEIIKRYGGGTPIREHFQKIYQNIFTNSERLKYLKLKKLLEDLEGLVNRSKHVVLWLFAKEVFRVSPHAFSRSGIVLSYNEFKKEYLWMDKIYGKGLDKGMLSMELKEIMNRFFSNEIELDCIIPPKLFHIDKRHADLLKNS
ncbi:hypothetical protein HOC01_01600 [archaeon]|jgi:hypothetical protein|nr:hypothetical protein [archaeon]MBT6697986.1 hypothetical protein [archaeon]